MRLLVVATVVLLLGCACVDADLSKQEEARRILEQQFGSPGAGFAGDDDDPPPPPPVMPKVDNGGSQPEMDAGMKEQLEQMIRQKNFGPSANDLFLQGTIAKYQLFNKMDLNGDSVVKIPGEIDLEGEWYKMLQLHARGGVVANLDFNSFSALVAELEERVRNGERGPVERDLKRLKGELKGGGGTKSKGKSSKEAQAEGELREGEKYADLLARLHVISSYNYGNITVAKGKGVSQDMIGWLAEENAKLGTTVEDKTAEFMKKLKAVEEEGKETFDASAHIYLLVESYAHPDGRSSLQGVAEDLKARGAKVRVIDHKPGAAADTAVATISASALAFFTAEKKKVVVIGHGVGALFAGLALARHQATLTAEVIAAFVSIQGAHGGSVIVSDSRKTVDLQRKAHRFFLQHFAMGPKFEMQGGTVAYAKVKKEWSAATLPLQFPVLCVSTSLSETSTSNFAPSARYIREVYGSASDGFTAQADAELPGSFAARLVIDVDPHAFADAAARGPAIVRVAAEIAPTLVHKQKQASADASKAKDEL